MLDKPGAECDGDNGFVDNAGIFAVLEGWFDVSEEGDRQRVALVDVGNIAVESSFGIVAGEKANIPKFPAEDCKKKKMARDRAREGGDPGLEQAASCW